MIVIVFVGSFIFLTLIISTLGSNTQDTQTLGKEIVEDLLKLYQCHPTEEAYRHFDANIEFEDPLEYAKGADSVRSSFNSLPKLFTKSETLWSKTER